MHNYHVGCGCSDPKIFYNAVKDARGVFDEADALGFNFTLLDVGGGFPGTEQFNGKFFEIADQINRGLEEFFPASSGVRIIAEPGTFFADSVFALVCKVITVKESTRIVDNNEGRKKEKLFMYYLNESMFGSFNGRPKSLRHPDAEVIKDIEDGTLFPSRLFGITCAPRDYLHEIFMLPKLQSGDYLMYRYFGAYSLATRSNFNGFGKASVHYIATESSYNDILKRLSANKLDE